MKNREVKLGFIGIDMQGLVDRLSPHELSNLKTIVEEKISMMSDFEVTADIKLAIKNMLLTGRKIDAIKYLRGLSGYSLMQSKRVVEAVELL